jgi:tRNA (guanine37-N1)-methyltransferase
MKRFDIISIFPDLFGDFMNQSLIARAIKKRLISIKAHDLRRWTKDRHKTVDSRPYGGGAGMVLMAEPIQKAVKAVRKRTGKTRVILLSAKGKQFSQKEARRLARYEQLVFICGRYEGVDERVAKHVADEELSVGPYVLFGGEVPAMVISEAISRLVPGVVQKEESVKYESHSKEGELEYPQYTRPEEIIIGGKKRKVPKVLLSGNHAKIAAWREGKRPAK